ncbi:MAG: hypothetical protein IID33_09560, partial [Planctomycetes bacterium]|nr:hypothetical protein [Planctomycetota bacterium]
MTKKLQAQGKLQMVGIIQEQHAQRCRLFMQWKKMDWPIMVDSFGLLNVSAVPITLGIDEHGVVHRLPRRPNPKQLAEEFLDKEFPKPTKAVAARKTGGIRAADALLQKKEMPATSVLIGRYSKVVKAEPSNGEGHFRLGVAYRMRYDSHERQPGDFQNAVASWQRALDVDPNQYIWRRRIQQYGPLLDKPYPFYDWVPKARKQIAARGQTPIELAVEPGGTELAGKGEFSPSKRATEPDPRARIDRDESPLIDIQTTVVPATVKPGQTARVHVVMRPNEKARGHWNNEAGELAFWIEPPAGWEVDQRLLSHPNAATDVSNETR